MKNRECEWCGKEGKSKMCKECKRIDKALRDIDKEQHE